MKRVATRLLVILGALALPSTAAAVSDLTARPGTDRVVLTWSPSLQYTRADICWKPKDALWDACTHHAEPMLYAVPIAPVVMGVAPGLQCGTDYVIRVRERGGSQRIEARTAPCRGMPEPTRAAGCSTTGGLSLGLTSAVALALWVLAAGRRRRDGHPADPTA